MAYAIGICVAAAFLAAYLLIGNKIKPSYAVRLDREEFEARAKALVKSLPTPEKSCKISASAYAASIRRNIFMLGRKRYGGEFDSMLVSKDRLKELSAFETLGKLPATNGEPRAVRLARFCLENSDMTFEPDRVRYVLEEQNAWKTLCYIEIEGMKEAFRYLLLGYLASFYEKLRAFAKCSDVAVEYVTSPAGASKRQAAFAKSKLFLSMCAKAAGYKEEFYSKLYDGALEGLRGELERICESIQAVEKFDFTPFYSPLEIYDRYEIFSSADAGTKRNFLTLAGEISDRENIDEFLLAIRVDKYMHSASSGHMALKRLKAFGRNFCLVSQRRDISALGAALSSHYSMDIYFRPRDRRFSNRSITKILEYENSFEPIYKFRTVNFGISTKGGKLRLSPKLPAGVLSADVAFEYGGVRHTLHLRRGEESALYLGETKINGVGGVTLGERPLDITVVLPRS